MILSYRAGTSVVHRLPAGVKLALLAVLALALSALPLSAFPHGAAVVAVVLLGVAALYVVARLPLSVLAREVWRLRWLVVVLGAALWIFVSPEAAWVSTGRVLALILLAALLTITTPMEQLMTVLRRLLLPLRRLGVDADAVAMTVSLTLTMIPVVASFAADVRDAYRARGIRIGIRGVVPLLVRALRHADEVGDALAARGLT